MMRTVNRNGVHIEQCDGCRGIFLDRGELEQIAGAESAYYSAPPPYQDPGGHRGYADSPRPYHSDSPRPYRGGGGYYEDSPRHYRGHRKRSFLENLFD